MGAQFRSSDQGGVGMKPSTVTAVLSAVLVGAVGCAATPPGTHSTVVPSSGVPSPIAPSPIPSIDPETLTNLGPTGVGPIRLGMTKAEVAGTGAASGVSGTDGTCGTPTDGRLIGAIPADDTDLVGQLFFSTSTGKLVIIAATPSQSTPEGIHLGSSVAQVKKAYPRWKPDEGPDRGAGLVAVKGNKQATYRIYVDADQVMELSLQSRVQDCT